MQEPCVISIFCQTHPALSLLLIFIVVFICMTGGLLYADRAANKEIKRKEVYTNMILGWFPLPNALDNVIMDSPEWNKEIEIKKQWESVNNKKSVDFPFEYKTYRDTLTI